MPTTTASCHVFREALSNQQGYTHKFAATKARYVKVNMLKNSDNPAVHLVEVRAFEAGK